MSTPLRRARSTTCPGSRSPSETVEWQCRSAFMIDGSTRSAEGIAAAADAMIGAPFPGGIPMPIFELADRRITYASDDHFIAPTASLIGAVQVGHQANVWFNCVLRADGEIIVLGDRANVQ